ncbi:MAG TPA: glycosyltransferase [Caulobacteraceae bacterium]|jgi:glycosyltransferase involved in cell wall biosynthesis|nr:glycosyltransferase [Caulobacteraceae bacterium]
MTEDRTPGQASAARTPSAATFVITAYNQEHCIEECLRSALAQDYPNLRIVVSDDASPDRTSEVIQDILAGYDGPHRTQFIQQKKNILGHHLAALKPEFIKDRFAVLGNGDDVFHPDRVSKSVRTMIREGTFSATVNAVLIDVDGKGNALLMDPDADYDLSLETLCRKSTNRACFGGGLAWRRAVFGQFGTLRPGPRQVDQIIVFRAALLGGVSLIREPLMRYRLHDANLNLGRMAELASGPRERVIEERRRNNVVATTIAQRELLLLAREKRLGAWDYDHLDRILLEELYIRTNRWCRYRAQMIDDGLGIF